MKPIAIIPESNSSQHLTFLHFLMMPCYMKCIGHSWCINCNLILHLQLAKLTSSQKTEDIIPNLMIPIILHRDSYGIIFVFEPCIHFFFIHKFVAHASLYPTHY